MWTFTLVMSQVPILVSKVQSVTHSCHKMIALFTFSTLILFDFLKDVELPNFANTRTVPKNVIIAK